MGFRAPDWGALANGMRPEGFPDDQDFGPSCLGWQREATREANTFPRLASPTLPAPSSGRKVVHW